MLDILIILIDIDECSDTTLNGCSNGAVCRNTNGSYECECPIGTKLENDARTCKGKQFVDCIVCWFYLVLGWLVYFVVE